MILWLRIPLIHDLDYVGLGRIFTAMYRTFYRSIIPFSVSDPNTRCVELWLGYNWDPSCLYNSSYRNITIGLTTGETRIDFMKNYKCFDAFFVTSKYYKDMQCVTQPVYVMHLGIEPEYFPYIERYNDKYIFAHIGITQFRKGSHLACKAFSKLFRGVSDAELHLICSGSPPMFRHLMKKYANIENIKFLNLRVPIQMIASLYYGDCLLFPSLREGWGLHLTEAMATGMPAIASQIPVLGEQFNDNCGWWVRVKSIDRFGMAVLDCDDLCDKMLYAYKHLDECKEKGIYAHNHIHKNFTWENIINTQLIPKVQNHVNVCNKTIHN